MTGRAQIYAGAEADLQRAYARLVQQGNWLDCPMIVSIETYAKCNAACTFCPYPVLPRQGARMERDQVIALIDEVASFARPPMRLNFSRVNEPFLDPRLFDFLEHAVRVLPRTELVLVSNGQAITGRTIERLNRLPTLRQLNLSFNEHDPETYARVMGLNQELTLSRLRHLHDRALAGTLNFRVTLGRVGTSDAHDQAFLDWCAAEFPAFPASSAARFDWIGTATSPIAGPTPDAGCNQWFSLHVLADGRSAFCCIDGDGQTMPMEIGGQSLLEIYNAPAKRRLRETLTSRRAVSGCAGCPHGMPSQAYARRSDAA